MQKYHFPAQNKQIILALGAESAGNFSLWENNFLHFSEDFGDLTIEANFAKFQNVLKNFLKAKKLRPSVILSDLHSLFQTTKLAQQLAKKYHAQYFPIQHHHAHLFSAIGDQIVERGAWNIKNSPITKIQSTSQLCHCEDVLVRSNPDHCQSLDRHGFSGTKILAMTKNNIQNTILGVACDGTGLGEDGKIWGGEIFQISNIQYPISNKLQKSKIKIQRIGHLENQILLGGEIAIQEPARMVLAILAKISNAAKKYTLCHSGLDLKSSKSHKINMGRDSSFHRDDININVEKQKDIVFSYIKKYYSKNEFKVLWNQLEQNFNCLETSSTARVLDAVSVLLGFSKNERLSKHQPVKLLEKNSTKPYSDIKPKITTYKIQHTNIKQPTPNELLVLNTTYLFEYLVENLHRDKKRLAATAQKYLADGMMEVIAICNRQYPTDNIHNTYFASGGMTDNKIISEIMKKQGAYLNHKIPRGDAGISFGQIAFYLLTK